MQTILYVYCSSREHAMIAVVSLRNVGQPLPRESPTNVLFDVFCPLLFDTRVIQASLVFQERLDRRCVFTTLFVVVVAFNLQELLNKNQSSKTQPDANVPHCCNKY